MKIVVLKCNIQDVIGCLSWYGHENQCWVPFQHVLCTITAPHFQGRSGQQYAIEKEGYNKIISSISKSIYQIKR